MSRFRWKYAVNGLANVNFIDCWPIYNDWVKICKKGNINEMNEFHDRWLSDMNQQLCIESFISQYKHKQNFHLIEIENFEYMFYDGAWKQYYVLKFDPYRKLLNTSARDIIQEGDSLEAILWFSKQKNIDGLQILHGLNTLILTKKIKEARIVMALFPEIPYSTENSDIFRSALRTGDKLLLLELLQKGAFHKKVKQLCDLDLERGVFPEEIKNWYIQAQTSLQLSQDPHNICKKTIAP